MAHCQTLTTEQSTILWLLEHAHFGMYALDLWAYLPEMEFSQFNDLLVSMANEGLINRPLQALGPWHITMMGAQLC